MPLGESLDDLSIQVAKLIVIVERLEAEVKICNQDHESRLRVIEHSTPWFEQCNRLAELVEKLESRMESFDYRIDCLEKYRDQQTGIKEFLPWVIGIVGGGAALIAWIRGL